MGSKEPETPAELSAYRCQLACQIGIDVLSEKIKTLPGVSKLEYAVYNLLQAVSELSDQIEKSLEID